MNAFRQDMTISINILPIQARIVDSHIIRPDQ
jgi:hypothetical protein